MIPLRALLTAPVVALIRCYQKYLSPLKGRPTCRFFPTCSQYAVTAYRNRGLIGGTVLTLWRILRCSPLCRGGFDPVPPGYGRPKRRTRGEIIPRYVLPYLPTPSDRRR